MKRSMAVGTPEEEVAADELAQFAADGSKDPGLRCWALRSLSRFHVVPLLAVRRLGAVVAAPGEVPVVRAWAAAALGEMRRKESIPYFVAALRTRLDETTGYFVLEGLGKVLPSILEDTETNQQVVEAMTAFAAGQITFVPEMYDLVNEYVVNLVVLAVAGQRILESDSAPPEEVYSAVYRMLAHLQSAKQKYLVSFEANRQSLARVFELAFASAERQHRPVLLLLAWYSGMLGDNRELAAFCVEQLSEWLEDPDPRLRVLATWSLVRMDLHSSQAHLALVQQVLGKEGDDRTLRILSLVKAGEDSPDTLQQVLRIRARRGAR